ncbi:MAG: putative Ig domain-containing protein [Burkholderiales bacterium]|nr:putative Ig domain-containing protein [Burkholderiales bacterium]
MFSFTLPKDTFKHADPKTSVVLEARGDNGPLPDWLNFEPSTGKFTGRPPESLASFTVIVTARDSTGNEASTRVVLNFAGKGNS